MMTSLCLSYALPIGWAQDNITAVGYQGKAAVGLPHFNKNSTVLVVR